MTRRLDPKQVAELLGGAHEDKAFSTYTVYCKPSDFPDHYVWRRHISVAGSEHVYPTTEFAVAATLPLIRALLPRGLENIGRTEGDDPVIVEVWI